MADGPFEKSVEDFKESFEEIGAILDEIWKKSNRNMTKDELGNIVRAKDNMMKTFLTVIQQTVASNESANTKLDQILSMVQKPDFPSLPHSAVTPTYAQSSTTRPAGEVVIIHPKKESNTTPISAEHIHEIIRSQIYSKKSKVKVIKINKNKSNATIVCNNKSDAENLINELSKEPTLSSKTNIFISKKQNPAITIRNIDKFYDDTNLIEDIMSYNPTLSQNVEDYKILFNINHQSTKDIVIRIEPSIFKQLHQLKFQVYIPGQLCYITLKTLINQCQNCYMFGHRTRNCNRQKMCLKCGTPKPEGTNHTCSTTQCCVNCLHFNSKNPSSIRDSNHLPNRPGCHYYDLNFKKAKDNVNYG